MENINISSKSDPGELIREFIRYLVVGGSAFFVDTGILILTEKSVFHGMEKNGIFMATASGFLAGLIYNYVLSFLYVFNKSVHKTKIKHIKSFVVFMVIGIVGLAITEIGMYGGISFFGRDFYIHIKIIMAGIVLCWNYVARKMFVFK